MSDDHNITGVWQGFYDYPGQVSVPFTATLLDTGRQFTGSISEPCVIFGDGETLFATVAGSRDGSSVTFLKTYDGSNPAYTVVRYAGDLNGEATEIEGRWTVPGDWSGRFLMIRSGRSPESAIEHNEAPNENELERPR